jgi:hypothetical protein
MSSRKVKARRPVSLAGCQLPAAQDRFRAHGRDKPTSEQATMTIDQTDDRDAFALGGRNGETATVAAPNRASDEGGSALGIAAPAGALPIVLPPRTERAMPDTHVVRAHRAETDVDLHSAFVEWAEKERAFAKKLEFMTDDEEVEREIEREYEREDTLFNGMVERPVEGAIGLAIKVFLALYGRYGNGETVPSVSRCAWVGENAGFMCSYVERALADDLVRFVPELTPLLAEAMTAKQKNPADEGEATAAVAAAVDDAEITQPADDFVSLADDAAFLEAEQEILRLRRERELLSYESDVVNERYFARIDELDKQIALSPPKSLRSLAVKLRRLLDPVIGPIAAFASVNEQDVIYASGASSTWSSARSLLRRSTLPAMKRSLP